VADETIHGLPPGTTLIGTEEVPIWQTGATVKSTVNALAALAVGSMRFVQSAASTTWTINHSLGFYPNVTAVDSTGRIIFPEVKYNSISQVVLTFIPQVAGEAYLS
jgi:hypothetical protein